MKKLTKVLAVIAMTALFFGCDGLANAGNAGQTGGNGNEQTGGNEGNNGNNQNNDNAGGDKNDDNGNGGNGSNNGNAGGDQGDNGNGGNGGNNGNTGGDQGDNGNAGEKDPFAGKTVTYVWDHSSRQLKFKDDAKIELYSSYDDGDSYELMAELSYTVKNNRLCTQTEKVKFGDGTLCTLTEVISMYKEMYGDQNIPEEQLNSIKFMMFPYFEYEYSLEGDQIKFTGIMFEDVKKYLSNFVGSTAIYANRSYSYSGDGNNIIELNNYYLELKFGSFRTERDGWIAQKVTETDVTYVQNGQPEPNLPESITIPYTYDKASDTFKITYDGVDYTLTGSSTSVTGTITESK